MGPLHFILDSQQFQKGLIAGIVAAGLVAAGAALSDRRFVPFAGVAFAFGSYVAMSRAGAVAQIHGVPPALLAGAAIAWVLAELARRAGASPWLLAIVAVPAGMVTAGALIAVASWVRITTIAFCAIGGASVADFERRNGRLGLAPFLWLITVGAVYSTVPDTEAARVLVGVAIPVACLGWPTLYAKLGTGGAFASVCILGWTIGQSGAARPGSVVGAIGALGVFALEPILDWVGARTRPAWAVSEPVALAQIAAVHLACALAAARWAGLAHDASTALLRLLVILPFALILTWLVAGEPGVPAPAGRY